MNLVMVLFMACARPPVAVEISEPSVWQADEDASLSWHGAGQIVRHGGRLYATKTQSWTALPAGWADALLSPDGRTLVRMVYTSKSGRETGVIEQRRLAGGKITRFEVPHFLDLSGAGEVDKAEMFAHTWVQWLGDGQLLVFETSYMAYMDCRLLSEGVFTEPAAGCPQSEYSEIYAVQPGPKHWLAVYSAGEGHPGVNLVRWQAEAQQPVPLPPIDLYPSGPLRMWFGADSDAIWLQTPCDLRIERGCMASAELDHTPPERLFRWRPSDPQTWQLLADGIAPGAVYDPQSNRFAWLEDGEIRVGRPI